ncbi:unnamed protein product [Allacma fusca]|uniref:Uncharacterized protein n=1 Tax=Allacma fusca TaxID=39272 RepID=A0A8J2LNC9_9HEXA|nr:unnamed protein product [Allacma fusca]
MEAKDVGADVKTGGDEMYLGKMCLGEGSDVCPDGEERLSLERLHSPGLAIPTTMVVLFHFLLSFFSGLLEAISTQALFSHDIHRPSHSSLNRSSSCVSPLPTPSYT